MVAFNTLARMTSDLKVAGFEFPYLTTARDTVEALEGMAADPWGDTDVVDGRLPGKDGTFEVPSVTGRGLSVLHQAVFHPAELDGVDAVALHRMRIAHQAGQTLSPNGVPADKGSLSPEMGLAVLHSDRTVVIQDPSGRQTDALGSLRGFSESEEEPAESPVSLGDAVYGLERYGIQFRAQDDARAAALSATDTLARLNASQSIYLFSDDRALQHDDPGVRYARSSCAHPDEQVAFSSADLLATMPRYLHCLDVAQRFVVEATPPGTQGTVARTATLRACREGLTNPFHDKAAFEKDLDGVRALGITPNMGVGDTGTTGPARHLQEESWRLGQILHAHDVGDSETLYQVLERASAYLPPVGTDCVEFYRTRRREDDRTAADVGRQCQAMGWTASPEIDRAAVLVCRIPLDTHNRTIEVKTGILRRDSPDGPLVLDAHGRSYRIDGYESRLYVAPCDSVTDGLVGDRTGGADPH